MNNDPDPDPNRLQELISSNALIASFLGPAEPFNISISSGASGASGGGDNDEGGGGGATTTTADTNATSSSLRSTSSITSTSAEEVKVRRLLHSISCSCDIEDLVAGIASDLRYFVKHCSSYDSTTSTHSNDSIIQQQQQQQKQVQVQVQVQVQSQTQAQTQTQTQTQTQVSNDRNISQTDKDNTNSSSNNSSKNESDDNAATTVPTPVIENSSSNNGANPGDDNDNDSANANTNVSAAAVQDQDQDQAPVQVPIQLQTLVYRISRLKSLLYNEAMNIASSASAPASRSTSENPSSNNNNNDNNNSSSSSSTITSNATSFIQHFFSMSIRSNAGDHHQQQQFFQDGMISTNTNANANANANATIVTEYQHKQNVKKILRTLLQAENNQRLIIPTLLQYIHLLPFEIRKNVSSIFNYLLVNTSSSNRSSFGTRQEFVLYVRDYFNVFMDFIVGGHFIHGIERGKSKNSTKKGNKERRNSTNINTSTSAGNVNNGISVVNDEIIDGENTIEVKSKVVNADVTVNDNNNNNNNSEQATNSNVQPTETAATKTTTTATTAAPKKRLLQQSIYKTPDVALLCGSMLRSIIRHPILYAQLVSNQSYVQKYIFPFLDCFVNQANFETASDALETLRLILHPTEIDIVLPSRDDDEEDYNEGDDESFSLPSAPYNSNTTSSSPISPDEAILLKSNDPAEVQLLMEKLSSTFLERDYTPIFAQRFNPKLLSSDHANYITRRVSLQLLSSILLTRSNYNIMIKYVSSKSNLRTIMMLLRDSSAHITLEAFNVFKIFVANPNKPPEVVRILADNKVKLIKYLSGLHKEREEMDEQFRDEKILVISTLEQMIQLE